MKKFLLLLVFSFLFFHFIPQPAFAYQYSGACSDLPQIPMSVEEPTTGTRTTQFRITIKWAGLSAADFAKYNNRDIYVRPYNSQDRPITTGAMNAGNNRSQTNATVTLSNFPVPEGDHTIYIHIDLDQAGVCRNYESDTGVITIAVPTPASTTGTPAPTGNLTIGSPCRQDLQSNAEFKCPAESTCTPASDNQSYCTSSRCKPASQIKTCDPNYLLRDRDKVTQCGTGINEAYMCTGEKEEVCVSVTTNGDYKCQTGTLLAPTPPCALNDKGVCVNFQTAIGGVSSDPIAFIKWIFGLLLGLSGGLAVAIIIYSGYKLMVSQGNKEGVQEARERLTSAIVGLVFLIFSLVILQIIGVDILSIPGFSAR